MLVLWLCCLGLFGYQQIERKRALARPCGKARIIVNGTDSEAIAVCYLNRTATFRLQGVPGADAEWAFDDGTPAVKGAVAIHQYASEGTYTVVAAVNGTCEYRREVTVTATVSPVPDQGILDIFPDSTAPKAGGTVKFYAVCDRAPKAYEWTLLETKDVVHDAVASFVFPAAGKYKVQLVINNDPSTTKYKTVDVADVPVPSVVNNPFNGGSGMPVVPGQLIAPADNPFAGAQPPPVTKQGAANVQTEPPKTEAPKPKATGIDPGEFKNMLQDVLNGDGEIDTLYPYLDYGESSLVKIDGEKNNVKLKAFCKEHRKEKIETLELKKDDKNGTWLQVKMESRGFFKKLFGKKG